MSRRILLVLSSILLNSTLCSQPMAMAPKPMMNLASQLALKTMAETSLHSWHITVPSGQVYTFTDQKITQIISTMPSDYQAQFFNDPGVLCSYIEKQNITPERLTPAHAQSHSRYQLNNDLSYHSSGYRKGNSAFERMDEIKKQLRENRTVPKLRIEINKTWAGYNDLRIKGEQKKLNAKLKDLEKDLASRWIFGKDELRRNIRYLKAILSQPITAQLAIVKYGPLDRAERIVNELKNSWPYYPHIITSITEQREINLYRAAVGFSGLGAAQSLLYARPDYQQQLIERQKAIEAERIAREQEIQSRCVISESLKPIIATIEQQTQDLSTPLTSTQEQEKAALLEKLKEYRFDWATTTPSQKQIDIDCEINYLTNYYAEHLVRATKPETKLLIFDILGGLQHLKKNNRTNYQQYKVGESQLRFVAHEVAQFAREIAEKTPHKFIYIVTHPVEVATNIAKANMEFSKFIVENAAGKYYLTPEQQLEQSKKFIHAFEQLREHIPQMSRGEWTDVLSECFAYRLLGQYGPKAIGVLNKIRVDTSNKEYVHRFIERIKFKIDTYAQRHPEVVTPEGLTLQVSPPQSPGWLQWMREKVWGGEKNNSILKPLGLGSTGRSIPKNLHEQLALQEIMSDPTRGFKIDIRKGMTDLRWPQEEGWMKMAWNNDKIEIHYIMQIKNGIVQAIDDFKFIDR